MPVRRISVDGDGAISVELADQRGPVPAAKDDQDAPPKRKPSDLSLLGKTPPPFDFEVGQ